MRYFVTGLAAAIGALALIAAAVNGGGGQPATATHEFSEWEIVQPTVTEPNFNDAARATATAWVEGCRTSGWTNANCLQPYNPYASGGYSRATTPNGVFDATGATIEFNAGTGTFIFYRFVRPHAATPEPTPAADAAATPEPTPNPIDCLNGIDQSLACQNMRSSGSSGPFELVCRPGVTYFRIGGGALQWTSGSVKGLRALHGDRFALAEECPTDSDADDGGGGS